jgi:hypothetical protein
MRLHLQEQVALYGDQNLVNLVNHKGYEQPIKEAYEKYVAQVCIYDPVLFMWSWQLFQVNLPKVKYEYFDFHNECKYMRWERISALIDKIQEDLVHQGSVADQLRSQADLQLRFQVLPSGYESNKSCSYATRNRANQLYG